MYNLTRSLPSDRRTLLSERLKQAIANSVKQPRQRRQRKRQEKRAFAFFKALSRLFQVAQFVA